MKVHSIKNMTHNIYNGLMDVFSIPNIVKRIVNVEYATLREGTER